MSTTNGRKKIPVRKRFTTGFEAEFFIIDKKTGAIAHGADEILEKVSGIAEVKPHNIVKEAAKNLIELGSYPDIDGANTMTNFMEGLKLLLYVADELGYGLLPLGTYPGKFAPSMRSDGHYIIGQKLYGNLNAVNGRIAGYHCHTSLPWGVFDAKTRMLKDLSKSKNQESLIHAYNMLIALDPALSTFMQSSPFYQAEHVGKDSRAVLSRGGQLFGMTEKRFMNPFPNFEALPRYEHSGTDLIRSIELRYEERMGVEKAAGVPKNVHRKDSSILTTNWTPVKVNPHGTLEQRGMDMNHLPLVLSVSVLIWRVLHAVQEKNYKVVAHDLAKHEPFKIEDNTIYIAPDTHVREHLQRLSAFEGLANDEIYSYCKRLIALVRQLDGEKVDWLLKPLETMLAERTTTADKIILQVQNLGHKDLKKPLPQRIAAEIAKTHSKQMFEDIVLLQKMIEENAKLDN